MNGELFSESCPGRTMILIEMAVLAFSFLYSTIQWFISLVVGITLRQDFLPESPLLSLLGLRPPFFGYAAILATVLIVKVGFGFKSFQSYHEI